MLIALDVVSDPAIIARSPRRLVQLLLHILYWNTHTITYDLGNGWPVGTDFILINLVK